MVTNDAEAGRSWRMLLVVGAAALLGGIVFAWSSALFPLVAGFLLAYLTHPLASFFERHRMPRILGFVVVMLLLTSLILLVILVFMPAVVHELVVIGKRLPSWREVTGQKVGPLLAELQRRYPEAYALLQDRLTTWVQQNLPSVAQRLASWFVGAIGSALSLVGTLLNLVLIPVIAAYLTVDFRRFLEAVRSLVPRPVLQTVDEVATDINGVLGSFLRGQLVVALALGVMYTSGMALVGAPLALVIGPLAGLLALVPYLGLVLGAGTSVILTLLEYQDPWHPLGVLVVFIVAQNIEG
jgi:predicted PurR-regulated permease PerM